MAQTTTGFDLFGPADRGTRYRLIACEVAYRECCLAAAVSRNVIDLTFLSQGLHDLESGSMRERLQGAIDATAPGRYAAVLLGYGLCNGGLVGVRARDVPLVLPRAHDCITLFLGSKEDYARQFNENKGTYFLTTGWIERDKDNLESTREHEANVMHRLGLDKSCEEYVALYGEEYARMIVGAIGGLEHYRKLLHIRMNVSEAAEARVGEAMREAAARRDWQYEALAGRMDLFLRLAAGEWDEERFLVVRPGQVIQQSHDESIIRAVDAAPEPERAGQ